MPEWFEDWFNTNEYLDVYRHRNDEEAKKLVSLILRTAKLTPGSSVLDMACGAGRHSILFAQCGYKVTAVDLSRKLLDVAKRSAAESGVKIDFVLADLRKYLTDKKFNLIVNLFTSFGYFEKDEDNFKILETAYNYLLPGGSFVIDFFNSGYLINNLVRDSVDEIKCGTLIQHREIIDNRVVKKITIKSCDAEKEFFESVRLFTPDEIISALKNYGFDIYKTFGDFNGSRFVPGTSPRIIITAGK